MIGILLLVSFGHAVRAEARLSLPLRSELASATLELAELTRQDIEQIHVDEHLIVVPLVSTNSVGDSTRSMGVLVPFGSEGKGGGNMVVQYVALFQLTDPEVRAATNQLEAKRPRNRHPHVALLGFQMLDNRFKQIPNWAGAVAEEGKATVPVRGWNCNADGDAQGFMVLRVDANYYGPHIEVSYDDGLKSCIFTGR